MDLNKGGIIQGDNTNPVDELIAKLGSSSWIERKESALKLGEYGDKIIPKVVKGLSDTNNDIKFWSMVVLAKISSNESLKPLFELAKSNNNEIRQYVAIALGYSKNQSVIKVLIDFLDDNDWRVCSNAINSLSQFGKDALNLLIERLKKASYNAAYWITKALSKMGDDGLEILIVFSKFKNRNVRMLITEALAESENPKAIRILVNALKDEYWVIRENVVEIFIKLGERVIKPLIYFLKEESEDYFCYVERVFKELGDYKLGPLIELLKNKDKEIRILSAYALGKTGSYYAVKPLLELLGDRVWIVRRSAAIALIQLGDKIVNDLLKHINDISDDNVRYWIAEILGNIGEKAIEPLITLLKSNDKMLRYYAAQAMSKIRDERVVNALIEALQDKEWIVRNNVANSLIKLGHISLKPIMKSLMSQNEERRFWARKIIEIIGKYDLSKIANILINDMDSEMRYFAAYTLSLIGNESCQNEIISAILNDPSEWVRKYSITALSKIKNKKSVDILIKVLYDSDEEIAYWAAKSFANLGEIALDSLKELLEEDDKTIKDLVVMALGSIGDDEAIKILIDRLKKRDLEAERCVRVLVECGKKAIPYLIKALGHKNINIRENSAKVLIGIGDICIPFLMDAMDSDNSELKYWASKVIRTIKGRKR